jgi:hypothetical protein
MIWEILGVLGLMRIESINSDEYLLLWELLGKNGTRWE